MKKIRSKEKIIIINFLKRNGKTVTAINLYTHILVLRTNYRDREIARESTLGKREAEKE